MFSGLGVAAKAKATSTASTESSAVLVLGGELRSPACFTKSSAYVRYVEDIFVQHGNAGTVVQFIGEPQGCLKRGMRGSVMESASPSELMVHWESESPQLVGLDQCALLKTADGKLEMPLHEVSEDLRGGWTNVVDLDDEPSKVGTLPPRTPPSTKPGEAPSPPPPPPAETAQAKSPPSSPPAPPDSPQQFPPSPPPLPSSPSEKIAGEKATATKSAPPQADVAAHSTPRRSRSPPHAPVRRVSPRGKAVAAAFGVGEAVRYWSATHGKWVECYVQRVNRGPDGSVASYDLTAKAQASIARVRHSSTDENAGPPDGKDAVQRMSQAEISVLIAPPPSAGPPFLLDVGTKVQYFSDADSKWMDAVIEARHQKDGLDIYDLNCQKGVTAQKLRMTMSNFAVGQDVEYWSTSVDRWIPAKVLKIRDAERQCDLDVKPGAPAARIRKATGLLPVASALVGPRLDVREVPGLGDVHLKGAPPPPLACGFEVGDKVQYWSETKGRWIEARVEGYREKDGSIIYDLNCKSHVEADRVRPSLGVTQERFQVGEAVEYWSVTAGRWLPAKVLRTSVGQCDLDVKQGAPLGRLRRVVTSDTNGHGATSKQDSEAIAAGAEASEARGRAVERKSARTVTNEDNTSRALSLPLGAPRAKAKAKVAEEKSVPAATQRSGFRKRADMQEEEAEEDVDALLQASRGRREAVLRKASDAKAQTSRTTRNPQQHGPRADTILDPLPPLPPLAALPPLPPLAGFLAGSLGARPVAGDAAAAAPRPVAAAAASRPATKTRSMMPPAASRASSDSPVALARGRPSSRGRKLACRSSSTSSRRSRSRSGRAAQKSPVRRGAGARESNPRRYGRRR